MKREIKKVLVTGCLLIAIYPTGKSTVVIADRVWTNHKGLHYSNLRDFKGTIVDNNCDLFKLPVKRYKQEMTESVISFPTGNLRH